MIPAFEALSGDAVLLRLGTTINASHNARALALAAVLREQDHDWLQDVVPAYASLAVFFNPGRIEAADPHAFVVDVLRTLMNTANATTTALPRRVEIPMCHSPGMAPDLQQAASELDMTTAELIERYCAVVYSVALIGFAPGFPYLTGLPEALCLSRLATPRTRVAAGSIGIGGHQTGIYPRESPGGWRLVGRTPRVLFDASREVPCLLAPGDEVRFVSIDASTFDRLHAQ